MSKRACIVFVSNNAEALLREVSDFIVMKKGRVLYRRISDKPIFILAGGEVGHAERV